MSNRSSFPMALLLPKVSPPRLPATLVVRERLLMTLDRALMVPLTLLSAPAGSGKTTLLRAWVARTSQSVAWLSLDELDNNPTRFWTVLIAALRTRLPEIGQNSLTMLSSPEPPPLTTILSALLEDMLHLAEPLVLIIDDYHGINEPAIQEGLIFLLEHLPPHLHLMLASRINPPFPLARWRLHGQVEEIRHKDLRFTQEETGRFLLESMHLPLAEEDVKRLAERTEGWIAGLQLAALALRQHEDTAAFVQQLSGSHRLLLDYVQEEILARQPARIQRFLFQVSVLTRMNASLCQAVTGEADCQQMLETLEVSNLFLVPLDEQQQWYRLHDLFRGVLLARLLATEPALAQELQSRAARWYEGLGILQEAIPYAVAAADYPLAATLMEQAAEELWLSGEARTVYNWVMLLPDPIFQKHARLALDAAFRLQDMVNQSVEPLRTRTQFQVEATIARVEVVLRTQETPTPSARLLQRRIELLRAGRAAFDAVTAGSSHMLQQLWQEMQALIEDEDDISWRMIPLALTFWMSESLQRQGANLVPQFLEAKHQASRASNRLVLIKIMRWLTHIYARAGQLHLAYNECQAALDLIEQVGGQTAQTGYLHYYRACIYYAWNRMDEALEAAQTLREFSHTWQQVDQIIVGQTYSAWLSVIAGELDVVPAMLAKAGEIVQQRQFALHSFRVTVVQVWYWLKTGNLVAARSWAEREAALLETWDAKRKEEFMTLIRVYLALHQHEQALAALQRFSTELDQSGDSSSRIEFLALWAAAYQQAGETERAREVAIRALTISEPASYVRVYVDVGQPMQEVLQSLFANPANSMIALPYISKLLTAFPADQTHAAADVMPNASPPPAQILKPGVGSQHPPLLLPNEPLTRREEEVLRLLAQGATNQDIARQLVVSLGTAKKHVASILSKLGAENRLQAVARARERSLL